MLMGKVGKNFASKAPPEYAPEVEILTRASTLVRRRPLARQHSHRRYSGQMTAR